MRTRNWWLLFFAPLMTAYAEPTKTVYNPFSGRPDYITRLDSGTLPSGSTQYIQNTATLQSGAQFNTSSGTVGELAVSTPTFGTSGLSNAYFLTPANKLWLISGVGYPSNITFGSGNGSTIGSATNIFGSSNMTGTTNNGSLNSVFGTLNLLNNDTGIDNFINGSFNMIASISGSLNFVGGFFNMQNGATSPQNNIVLGYLNGLYTPTIVNNIMIGDHIASATNSSSLFGNVLIGNQVAENLTSATGNVFLGFASGFGITNSTPTTSGSENILIGYDTSQGAASQISKSIGIGVRSHPTCSNCALIGGAQGSGDEVTLMVSTMSVFNHYNNKGSTAPWVTSCGTGPGVTGYDSAGTITVGSGVTTACTLNFATAWGNAPTCVITTNSTAVTSDITSVTTSALALGFSATLGGGTVYYHCIGRD
jgi:hypothetical protein